MEQRIRDRITWRLDDQGIAHVQLDRPERMNSLDGAMFDAILETTETLGRLPQLRAVVLSGNGKAFCAGLDVANFERLLRGDGVDVGERSGGADVDLVTRRFGPANGPQQVVLAWRDLPVPVIAAVHGVAFGGGLQLALGADLRFATPDARLAVLEIAWGLVPDMAGMPLLRQLVRDDRLCELVYSGRELTGEEALSYGLVTRVCADPLAQAQAFAADLALKSPDAVRAAKRLLRAAAAGADVPALLLAESQEQQRLIGSANQREAVRARMERRAPQFSDPQT